MLSDWRFSSDINYELEKNIVYEGLKSIKLIQGYLETKQSSLYPIFNAFLNLNQNADFSIFFISNENNYYEFHYVVSNFSFPNSKLFFEIKKNLNGNISVLYSDFTNGLDFNSIAGASDYFISLLCGYVEGNNRIINQKFNMITDLIIGDLGLLLSPYNYISDTDENSIIFVLEDTGTKISDYKKIRIQNNNINIPIIIDYFTFYEIQI